MAKEVSVTQAKNRLSRLLKDAAAGQETVITKSGKPIARLVAAHPTAGKRRPGGSKGRIVTAPDFDDPLPEDILQSFGA
jgi:prevent-host-death family protein